MLCIDMKRHDCGVGVGGVMRGGMKTLRLGIKIGSPKKHISMGMLDVVDVISEET